MKDENKTTSRKYVEPIVYPSPKSFLQSSFTCRKDNRLQLSFDDHASSSTYSLIYQVPKLSTELLRIMRNRYNNIDRAHYEDLYQYMLDTAKSLENEINYLNKEYP